MSEEIVFTNTKIKTSKPVMEKKRRARINQSLDELKVLILDATMKKDISCRHSKLEKADILEMTVRYLKNLRNHQIINSLQRDPLTNYRAGFNECRGEITRYLATVDGIGIDWKLNLLEHLATCCHASAAGSAVMKTPLGAPCLPNMPKGLNHPSSSSSVLSLLQQKQEHSAQFRMSSANNLANAKIATILVPTSASPFLMTTSQPSGHQDLIPVLCMNPMETRSPGVTPEAPVNSSLWRPF